MLGAQVLGTIDVARRRWSQSHRHRWAGPLLAVTAFLLAAPGAGAHTNVVGAVVTPVVTHVVTPATQAVPPVVSEATAPVQQAVTPVVDTVSHVVQATVPPPPAPTTPVT